MRTDEPAGRERLLVVDDNLTTAGFVGEILSDTGYDPVICLTGAEALAQFGAGDVALVVLDVLLPDMTGVDVARSLKQAAPPDSYLPVIMLSALASEEDKIRGLEFADDYVTKPFSRVELLARVRTFLRIRKMHLQMVHSRRLYQHLHDHAPFMYLSLGTDLTIRSCNHAFQRTVGVDPNGSVGRSAESFFVEDERLALNSFLAEAGAVFDEPREARFVLAGAQGERIEVLVRACARGWMAAGTHPWLLSCRISHARSDSKKNRKWRGCSCTAPPA